MVESKSMGINWKKSFSTEIVKRGKIYYDSGFVQKLSKLGDTFHSTVTGTDNYTVVIRVTGDKIMGYCDCPYTNYCKHMAATLYAMEAKGWLVSAEDGEVENPFKNFLEGTDEPYFFDMAEMTRDIKFNKISVENAKKILEEQKLVLENKKFLNEFSKIDFVSKETGRFGHVEISLCENRISEIISSVPKSRWSFQKTSWGIYCSEPAPDYVVAALFMLADIIKKENPCDSTNKEADALFDFFNSQINENVRLEENDEEPKEIKFIPQVKINSGYISVSFKTGCKKICYVSNLVNLVECYKDSTVYEVSKSETINFAKDYFDEVSKKYFDFAKAIIDEENTKQKIADDVFIRDFSGEKVKSGIYVYGKRLDDFFEMAKGSEIDLKGMTGSIKFNEISPHIKMNFFLDKDKNDNINSLIMKGEIFDTFRGADYFYTSDQKYFSRIEKSFTDKISFLLKFADYKNEINFTIGKKRLAEFVFHILPWIREFAEVDENNLEEVLKILPPQGRLEFNFDTENEIVYCSAKSIYGDKIFDTADFLSDEKYDYTRDTLMEKKACNLLKEFFESDLVEKKLWTDDEEKIFNLLNGGLSKFMELGTVNVSESFGKLKIHQKTSVSVGVKLESNLLNLEIQSEEISRAELLEILEGMKRRKKYIRLRNGDFINTQDESLEELNEIFETLKISPKEFVQGKIKLPAYRSLYLDKMLENTNGLYLDRDKNFRNLVKDFKTVEMSDFEPPENLISVMRNYQIFGYKWMRTLSAYNFAGILADDMGLGKTLQTISVILSSKKNNENGCSLIICPASLVFNWKNEFKKFAPELNCVTVSGTASERAKVIASYNKYDALITSYDLLKRDITEYEEKEFLYEIIDEGQYIKNHTTAASKSVKIISAKHKLALTGTPIENRLSELWSIFDYLMPGYLFSYDNFRKNFEIPIVQNKNQEALSQLKKMVSPFILRRIKNDVLKDLPEKIEEIHFAEFDDKQKKLYDAQVVRIQKILAEENQDDFNKGKIQILAELTKIRQICCDPSLLYENYTEISAKRSACLELIQSGIEGEHKMLVFSQWTTMLDILGNDLSEKGIPYYKITGETEKKMRLELVNKFNEDSTPVFLISLKAGGTGLNLTGADVVIHYDPWWNLAAQNQATDRAHRIGQTKVVSVFKLIAKNSIEEKIIELQNLKKNLADEILNGENGNIGSMSKEEILALL